MGAWLNQLMALEYFWPGCAVLLLLLVGYTVYETEKNRPKGQNTRVVASPEQARRMLSPISCPLCNAQMMTDGGISSDCKNGHELLCYTGLDNTYYTASEAVAKQLIADGRKGPKPMGGMWVFYA